MFFWKFKKQNVHNSCKEINWYQIAGIIFKIKSHQRIALLIVIPHWFGIDFYEAFSISWHHYNSVNQFYPTSQNLLHIKMSYSYIFKFSLHWNKSITIIN